MHSTNPQSRFVYVVDAHNRLISVNLDWLSFACENQARELDLETVLGQSIFSFVTDRETKCIYEMIIEKVRKTQQKIIIPFRCDGPEVRRFMELEISPGDEGQIEFVGRIVREEKRESVPLLDSAVDRSNEFVVVCSWCKRVDVSGVWLEVELAVKQMKIFHEMGLPQLTHGICPDCAKRLGVDLAPDG